MSTGIPYRLLSRSTLLALVILFNCKDPIDIKGTGSIGVLVASGQVSTQPGPYTLQLGFTVGIDQKPSPAVGAQVILYDDTDGLMEEFFEEKAGQYAVPGNVIQGTPGHTYHVTIRVNEKDYASKPETIPAEGATGTPSFEAGQKSNFIGETEVKQNVMNVYADTQFPSEKEIYVRWDVTETFYFAQTPIPDPFSNALPRPCYISGVADPQRINLFTNKGMHVNRLSHSLVAVRAIDKSFIGKHFFNLYTSTTTAESYVYWKNVDQLINRSGSIFDTPPAPISGNVSSVADPNEAVFGYFEATNTTLSRVYTVRSDVPYPVEDSCFDPRYGIYWGQYPPECYDCLRLDNSTNVPPAWFLDGPG